MKLSLITAAALLVFNGSGCTQSRMLQAQIDELKSKQGELRSELYSVESQLKEVRGEVVELQRLTTQMGNTVLAMRSATSKTSQAAPVRRPETQEPSRTTVKPKHKSKKRYHRN